MYQITSEFVLYTELEELAVRAETHQNETGRCVGFCVNQKQIRTQMTFSEASHLAGESMIIEFWFEIMIGCQRVQNSGKQSLKIAAIPGAGSQFFIIPLELARPVNLPHSVDPSILERWRQCGDFRA